MNLNIGVKKELFQFNRLTLGCTPTFGYSYYLTNHNDWQKKCFLAELKFNFAF